MKNKIVAWREGMVLNPQNLQYRDLLDVSQKKILLQASISLNQAIVKCFINDSLLQEGLFKLEHLIVINNGLAFEVNSEDSNSMLEFDVDSLDNNEHKLFLIWNDDPTKLIGAESEVSDNKSWTFDYENEIDLNGEIEKREVCYLKPKYRFELCAGIDDSSSVLKLCIGSLIKENGIVKYRVGDLEKLIWVDSSNVFLKRLISLKYAVLSWLDYIEDKFEIKENSCYDNLTDLNSLIIISKLKSFWNGIDGSCITMRKLRMELSVIEMCCFSQGKSIVKNHFQLSIEDRIDELIKKLSDLKKDTSLVLEFKRNETGYFSVDFKSISNWNHCNEDYMVEIIFEFSPLANMSVLKFKELCDLLKIGSNNDIDELQNYALEGVLFNCHRGKYLLNIKTEGDYWLRAKQDQNLSIAITREIDIKRILLKFSVNNGEL